MRGIVSQRDEQDFYNIFLSLFPGSPFSPEDLTLSGYSPQGEIVIRVLLRGFPKVKSRGRRDKKWRIDKKNYSITRYRVSFSEKESSEEHSGNVTAGASGASWAGGFYWVPSSLWLDSHLQEALGEDSISAGQTEISNAERMVPQTGNEMSC